MTFKDDDDGGEYDDHDHHMILLYTSLPFYAHMRRSLLIPFPLWWRELYRYRKCKVNGPPYVSVCVRRL